MTGNSVDLNDHGMDQPKIFLGLKLYHQHIYGRSGTVVSVFNSISSITIDLQSQPISASHFRSMDLFVTIFSELKFR